MKKICKQLIGLLFCIFVAAQVFAQDVEKPFRYETTWRILQFSSSHYTVNERSEDEYDAQQGFSYIYDILIKYVHFMKPFNEDVLQIELKDLGIWCELYLVNNETYQILFVGEHILSDGNGWVLVNDADYKKLSDFLIERSDDTDNPYDGDKEKTLSHHMGQIFGQPFDEYDAHFKRMANEAGGITGRELESNASGSIELINPKSINEINSSVDSKEIGVTSSSAKSADVQAEDSEVVNVQSSVGFSIPAMPTTDESIKITNTKNSGANQNSSQAENASQSLIGWLILAGLGLALVWYYWRRK